MDRGQSPKLDVSIQNYIGERATDGSSAMDLYTSLSSQRIGGSITICVYSTVTFCLKLFTMASLTHISVMMNIVHI